MEKRLKVLLIQPRISAEKTYPLILGNIAAQLPYSAVGVDLQFDEDPYIRADLVVSTALEHNASQLHSIFSWHRNQGAITIVVGDFPTAHPQEALRKTGAQYAFCGDPERGIAQIASGEALENVNGLSRGEAVRPAKTWLKDLKQMDRVLFPPLRYSYEMRSTGLPYTMLITSRGCQRACGYCPRPSRHPDFDARTPTQIVAELDYLHRDFQINTVHIEDDAFYADRARVLRFCQEKIRANNPVFWEVINGVRPADLDAELIQASASAGCRKIVLAIECLSNKPKGLQSEVEKIQRLIQLLKKNNIRVGGYFVVGLPETSLFEELYSLKHSLTLGLDDANWIRFHPLRDSPYEGAKASKIVPHVLSVAATGLFHLTNTNLMLESRDNRKISLNICKRGLELIFKGGPPPAREMP